MSTTPKKGVAGQDAATTSRDDLVAGALHAGRLLGAASVRFHNAVAAHQGLGASEVKAVDLLIRHGDLSPRDLGTRLGLAPASVTGLLHRLEQRDLIRRIRHPEDGRRLVIQLDPDGYRRLQPLFHELSRSLTDYYEGFTDSELSFIVQALTGWTHVLDEVIDRSTTTLAAEPTSAPPHPS